MGRRPVAMRAVRKIRRSRSGTTSFQRRMEKRRFV
jgi:hypothetical protein